MQVAGWTLLFAIVALSLAPQPLRPVTPVPHIAEHATIFFFAGLALGLAYSSRFLEWLLGLSTFTLGIEIAQLWVPGRHARWLDFIVDVSAIALGLGIGFILSKRSTILS